MNKIPALIVGKGLTDYTTVINPPDFDVTTLSAAGVVALCVFIVLGIVAIGAILTYFIVKNERKGVFS
jgi:hypothetical protein